MTPKEAMLAKFDNLDDIKLTSSLCLLQRQIKQWCDAKPDNVQLQQVRDAIVDVTLITNKLQLDRGNYHIALDQYRTESLRMVTRARKAEDKINVLQKKTYRA